MYCNCQQPAKPIVGRDGKLCYICSYNRCRFYALSPVMAGGYARVVQMVTTPPDICIIRFEALLHPVSKEPAVMCVCEGGGAYREEVRAVLEDPMHETVWYVSRAAYLYAMAQYQPLLSALKALPHGLALVEEVPAFFFSCLKSTTPAPLDIEEEANERARSSSLASSLVLDPADVVMQQLKPFQKDGAAYIVAHGGRGMIADDMGLGKTVQSIAVAHHYREEWPVLVICPMSLMENWAKEFNRFCGIPFSRIVVLQGTKARATSMHQVAIVSYSSLKCVESANFAVVVLDESHYIKAADTKRSQLALRLCRSAKRVVLLSGTPAMSRPIELYTQLQAIHPTLVPSRVQFGSRYCNAYVSRFGVDMTGHSHSDELHFLLTHFIIRRTKKELAGELPSKARQLLYIYVTEKEKKALAKQIGELRKSMNIGTEGSGGSGDYATRSPNAFELKIATARAKIPAVQDYIMSAVEQHLESGEKIIFFAHHQCMMEAIRSAVEGVRPKQPLDYIYISGDTPGAQREQLAEHFRREPTCAVAILSMQSSGTGHNFTCATTVVFAELDWNPSTHLQCEDRVHRIGQSNPCTIKYLLAEGTSDSVIWPLLQSKLTVTTAMLESSEEVRGQCQLQQGADTGKVVRRDVSPAAGGTQCTLDAFVKVSPRSDVTPEPTQSGAPRLSAGVAGGGSQSSTLSHAVAESEVATPAAVAPPLVVSLAEMKRLHLQPRPPSLKYTAPKPTPSSPAAPPAEKKSVLELMRKDGGGDGAAVIAAAGNRTPAQCTVSSVGVNTSVPLSVAAVAMQGNYPSLTPSHYPTPGFTARAAPPSSSTSSCSANSAAAAAGGVGTVAPRRTVFTLSSLASNPQPPEASSVPSRPPAAIPATCSAHSVIHLSLPSATTPAVIHITTSTPSAAATAMGEPSTTTRVSPHTLLRVPIVASLKRGRNSDHKLPLSVTSSSTSVPAAPDVAVCLPHSTTTSPPLRTTYPIRIGSSSAVPQPRADPQQSLPPSSANSISVPEAGRAGVEVTHVPDIVFDPSLLGQCSGDGAARHSARTTFVFHTKRTAQ